MNVCGSGIMHMEDILLAAYVGCQSCFNRSDRCIYWPEQGNCLPIFGAFSILLHVHCAPFLIHPRSRQIWSTDLVWAKLKIEEKVANIAQRNQKRGVKEKSVNREKHENDKMMEDSNTHGSEASFNHVGCAFNSHHEPHVGMQNKWTCVEAA
jgi:hypothetical protein